MKIAFVIQKIAARSGGAERVLIETANELSRRGYTVEILSHENRGKPPFYPMRQGVRHKNLFKRPIEHKDKERWSKREKFRERLPHFFPLNHLKWRMTHSGFVRELRRYIHNEKPDVLIPFLPAAITPCALAAKGTGVKVVASTHNEPSQDYENPKRWDSNPIDVRLRRECLRYLDKILVLLPTYKDWYPAELHHKVDEMPNPVRPVDPQLLASAQREKLVLGVGRLAGVKRFEILIEAWLDLRRKFPDWRVEIYGDGPDRAQLARAIEDYGLDDVVFLKGVSSNMSELYLKASVLAHPAEYEGFPLAVCEALAHGLPVVGFSDCSGVNSLVHPDQNGILVVPGANRVDSFQSALSELLPDQDRLSRFSAASPETVAQYRPDNVYDKWEGLIQEMVGHEDEEEKLYW
ncbi:glycosyltransferase family 4 protein [Sinorhizobium meliloti]|uniref:glycosyltransferase family 4 protein n=1 Tax=Rhizobium meliloti TaxID=382 RepID=UPI00037E1E39|nr:glycosyltransferase family 4 protein [Sinorhizobium meliloti]ASP88619.1 glycosyltransferase family 4 protein [Sinorhizobium meliloti]MDE4552687.1 glycosyltransferase family 4 protein [Sinorhizobium meliloti]MQW31060.1 glycosyltransferase [Sinorhizobium meliloti]MQW43252.1 glycosyltransferase [Sinorhizobium meliloti]MQW60874.1 glycosyltransferase [Sinorhizobium meliloti]